MTSADPHRIGIRLCVSLAPLKDVDVELTAVVGYLVNIHRLSLINLEREIL